MSEASAVSVESLVGAKVVHVLAPDLSEQNMAAFRGGIAQAAGQSSDPFIIDLANVKYLPSLTLGAFVGMVNEFRARKQRLIFVCLRPTIRQVVSITRLDRVLEIMDDVATALRSVGAGT